MRQSPRCNMRGLNYNLYVCYSLPLRELVMLFGVGFFREVVWLCRRLPPAPDLFGWMNQYCPDFWRVAQHPAADPHTEGRVEGEDRPPGRSIGSGLVSRMDGENINSLEPLTRNPVDPLWGGASSG